MTAKTTKNSEANSNNRFHFYDLPNGEYAHVISFSSSGNRSLWNAESIRSMCRLNGVIRSNRLFPSICQPTSEERQYCPSWSLGPYVAVMSNRSSCADINEQNVETALGVLRAFQVLPLRLSPNCYSVDPEVGVNLVGAELTQAAIADSTYRRLPHPALLDGRRVPGGRQQAFALLDRLPSRRKLHGPPSLHASGTKQLRSIQWWTMSKISRSIDSLGLALPLLFCSGETAGSQTGAARSPADSTALRTYWTEQTMAESNLT